MTAIALFKSEIREIKHQVLPSAVPLEALSLLTQVRMTVDVAEDLIPSIAAHGQQTPGVAVALLPEEAQRYIEELNELWGSRHRLKDFPCVNLDGVLYYFFLVAGHRRYKACAILAARAEQGLEQSVFDGLYRVDIRFGMEVSEAISLQFNENRHQQIPPHEEARAAWKFYRWLQKREPDITIAKFARRIGRTSEWVRGALRFCSLPSSVQKYADGADGCVKLPYGILTSLARLGEKMSEIMGEEFPEAMYHEWITRAVIDRLNVETFGKTVSAYLASKQQESHGQFPLFGSVDEIVDERPIRRVVAEQMVPAVWTILNYLKSLERVRAQGGFGDKSHLAPERDLQVRASYSPSSPIRIVASILEHFGDLMPHLEELARREGGRNRKKLQQGAKFLPVATKLARDLSASEE